ncbi:MAG: extracellular solute-binding protein [Clostridia bacterium]|nr:extracellular solute-binding protein [Clostridia bacterium]
MKKLLALLLVSLLVVPLAASAEATLTMGSWRPDDSVQMNELLAAYKEIAPDVTISFEPTINVDYNATLRLQLDSGTGPDLFTTRSFANGLDLYKAGFLADLTDVPGITENFIENNRAPWSDDGTTYSLPFAAVSHGVYYNIDIFKANNLTVPATWEDFMAVCQTLKDAGIIPIGNGVADEWDILECVFCSMISNYIGGAEERVKFETGERKLTDPAFVEALVDLQSLAQYLPADFSAVAYNDGSNLFGLGQCAMYIDGSWSAGVYDDVDFVWSVFPVPAREGRETIIPFHPDMGIAVNAASPNAEAAKAFVAWLATPEGAQVAADKLPKGFFPMIDASINISEEHCQAFLAMNEGSQTDCRFVFAKLTQLYTPMNQEIIKVLKGEQTPEGAAEVLAALLP